MSAICATIVAGIGFKAVSVGGVFPHPLTEHLLRAWHVLLGDDLGRAYLEWLWQYPVRTAAFYGLPLTAAALAGWGAWAFFGRIRPGFKHIRGRRLLRGKEAMLAAQQECERLVKAEGVALELFPGILLGWKKLRQSIMICGAQGGGKTVLINNGINDAIERGHKAIVFDPTKGDFSRWVPMSGKTLMLISLTDSRSLHWHLGWDLLDVDDARGFAAGLIPDAKEPMWSDSARMIIMTAIMSLIAERGREWSWPELAARCTLSIEELNELAQAHYPPAAGVLNPESKTSQSIFINMAAFAEPIHRIAQQVRRIDPARRISLLSWLMNDNINNRRIIVQMNQRAGSASSALARALVEYMTIRIASLEFSESETRRVGFWLDEIPQFGKLGCISKLMEVGRSKGVYCVFGFQDYAQIEQIYGPVEAKKWAALFGIKAFPQVQGAASQKFVSDEIGSAEVSYRQQSVSGTGVGSAASVSNSWGAPTLRPVILPNELGLYGLRKDGIEALFIGIGPDCLALRIPFPFCPDIRPAHVPWSAAARASRPGANVTAHATKQPKMLPTKLDQLELTTDFATEKPQTAQVEDHDKAEQLDQAASDADLLIQMTQQQIDAEQQPDRKPESAEAQVREEIAVNQVAEVLSETVGIPSILTELIAAENEIIGQPAQASGQRKRRTKKSLQQAGISREG